MGISAFVVHCLLRQARNEWKESSHGTMRFCVEWRPAMLEKGFRLTARFMRVAALLTLAACSRSGSVYGDISVSTPPGGGKPAARLSVKVISATDAFERDWSELRGVFREALTPAQRTQEEATAALDQAKLAWDRALAMPRGRHRPPGAAIRERELWRQVRGAEQRLAQAKSRVRDVDHTYDLQGAALLDQHTTQLVQADETGHYVVAAFPVGAAYLYTRVVVGGRTLVWFRRVQVQAGAMRVDLTEANSGGWPFVP